METKTNIDTLCCVNEECKLFQKTVANLRVRKIDPIHFRKACPRS